MTETAESNLHHEFYAPETSVAGTTALDEMNIISSTPAAAAEQVDGIEILVNMAKQVRSTRGMLILLISQTNILHTFFK